MSRIHEALKKAEKERGVVQASEIAASMTAPAATPALERENAAASPLADILTQTAVISPSRGDYLRFDDLRTHCAHPHWDLDPDENVFSNPALSVHGTEQFRTLRSRLYQLRANQALRTLLITSSLPGEGKTFVASNLAQAIVRQPDRRALIIDADLRLPRLHLLLGAPAAPGLTDYLSGAADEMAIIQHGQEENLWFIPSGKAVTNPSELLSNGRLKPLLDCVKPVFDWVIVDAPPCLAISDASVLADLCDGVLLVLRAASTPAATAQRACQELQGRNVVGVVMNALEDSPDYAASPYYYYGASGENEV
jgi:protein-tyrosine kinase